MIVTAMVVAIASTGVRAGSGNMDKIMADIKAEKHDVNVALANFNHQQDRVEKAGKQCHEQRTAAAHKEYKDAKADMKNARNELMKQEKQLMLAHKAHVREHKAEVRAEVRQLEKAQRAVDKDKIRGNVKVLGEAETLMDARAELRNRLTALERARLDRDKDYWIINHQMSDGDTNLQLSEYGTESNNINVASK
jgi:hypothetical protein